MGISTRRTALGVAVLATAGLALGACSAGSADDPSTNGDRPDPGALDQALEDGGELTYWTWTTQAEAQVAAFEQAYPNVSVNLVNPGTGTDAYTALENAIAAGSGAPDVAQIGYLAMPQFYITESLVDLSQYGFDEFQDIYATGPWDAVTDGDAVYGLPQDSGPMALLYNEAVYQAAGIEEPPATWDEFVDAARAIRAYDPEASIIADTGDGGMVGSLIWQAGGHPFEVDGTTITINLQDEGTRRWTAIWNQLVEEDLLSPISGWSNEWYQALNQGKIASLVTAAWMPANLEGTVEASAGDWRAAPIPSYDGQPASAENGGSAQVVMEQSDQPELAAAFLRWLNSSKESIEVFIDGGGYPATVEDLNDEEFLSRPSEFFGGQEINRVFAEASEAVLPGWQFLPYHGYAVSVAGDTVGQAYAQHTDLNPALSAWQAVLVDYGESQGFTVIAD